MTLKNSYNIKKNTNLSNHNNHPLPTTTTTTHPHHNPPLL